MEHGTDFPASLLYAYQAPMLSTLLSIQVEFRNTAPVVAAQENEMPPRKIDLTLDSRSSGMTECVRYYFASNHPDFLMYDRLECRWSSLNRELKRR